MILRRKLITERPLIPEKLRFLIVTAFTSLNLLLGLLALFAAVEGILNVAVWSLLACVVVDGIDGALARHWQVQSPFGAQLDSLADMTSFTIASAVLAFYWLQPDIPFKLIFGASCFYTLSGAVRLARFNVSLPSSQYFQGMPTTVAGAVVAIFCLAYPDPGSIWGIIMMLLLAVLMVTTLPYPKFRHARKFPVVVWLLISVGAVLNLSLTLVVLALFYTLTGPFIWLYRRYSVQ